jgi:hypothetical protein
MSFMEGVLCFICVVCFGVLYGLSIWASWRVSYVLFVSFVLVYYTTCLYELTNKTPDTLHEAHIDRWCSTPKQTTQIKHKTPSMKEGVLCFICVVCFGVLYDLFKWASWRVSYVLFVSFVLVFYTTCLFELLSFMEGVLCFICVVCFGVLHDLSIKLI